MKKTQVHKKLYDLTEKISTLVRTAAIGLIAVIWGLLISDSTSILSFASSGKKQLISIGLLAITTILFDFLQYFFGFWFMNDFRRILVKDQKDELPLNVEAFRYKLRGFLFWVKQVILIVAIGWFLIFMLSTLLG
jgi:hypothetical protein